MNQQTVSSHLNYFNGLFFHLNSLVPSQFAQIFHQYSYIGINDQILSLLQHYFYQNINHPDAIKYIYCIDQMFLQSRKLYPYKIGISKMLIGCYYQCFLRKQINKLQELKIINKIWHLYLSENELSNIKNEIKLKTKQEIDGNLRSFSKQFIFQFFEKKGISKECISRIMEKRNQENKQIQFKEGTIRKKIKKDDDFAYKARIQQESIQKDLQPAERKKTKEGQEKFLMILNNLKEQNIFECYQCGKRFTFRKNLKFHEEQHVERRIKKFHQNKKRKKINSYKRFHFSRQERTQKEWVGEKRGYDFYIREQTLKINEKCYFCLEKIKKTFQEDQWLLKNVMKIEVNKFAHTECYDLYE